MKCKICANDDPRLLIEHQATLICRKCIMFQKGLLKENTPSFNEDLDAEYVLEFQLSNKQLELSKKLIMYVEEGHDVLVYAACGERVIIVMGAVCVIKSRVSGTLNIYISCIA